MDILLDVGLIDGKPTKFSLPDGLKLLTKYGNPLAHPKPYRRAIRRLLHLTLTRPLIS